MGRSHVETRFSSKGKLHLPPYHLSRAYINIGVTPRQLAQGQPRSIRGAPKKTRPESTQDNPGQLTRAPQDHPRTTQGREYESTAGPLADHPG